MKGSGEKAESVVRCADLRFSIVDAMMIDANIIAEMEAVNTMQIYKVTIAAAETAHRACLGAEEKAQPLSRAIKAVLARKNEEWLASNAKRCVLIHSFIQTLLIPRGPHARSDNLWRVERLEYAWRT